MKKLVLSAAVLSILSLLAYGNRAEANLGLPALNTIKEASLSPCYSCRPAEEFNKGYQNTALFLSAFAKQRNSPDLLFNGAVGMDDYFEASTAGDDMSLIADLGSNVSLEDLSASRAFNLARVHSFANYSKFQRVAKVELDHTYAVLLNASDKRGLFVFSVAHHVPTKRVDLRYAVKMYDVTSTGQVKAPGFDWSRGNAR